ncbi:MULTISPECIES: hypothetical protein [Fervidobacterium]|uniref:Uncharacterized protein n=1 Tax=Fervidobacterium islandicum TaxID=2423 RepID=A0AAJ5HWM4_FERIS|nr:MULTISPECIES: hypothetical protein [Fervidobacterium]UOE96760.1 hypothetical protein NA23_10785 [Fervidobacterium islandicum]
MDEKRYALELIGKKYSNNLEKIKGEIADSIQRVSIIKIEIEHISGKSRKR